MKKYKNKLIYKNGYPAFKDDDGKIIWIHRREAEKKYGLDELPKEFEVHHIDGNPDNNQYWNLILLHKKDHNRIHKRKTLVIRSKRSDEE